MTTDLFHRIGSFISPFGVTLVLAFLTSFLQLRWGMRKLGIGDEEDASALIFAAFRKSAPSIADNSVLALSVSGALPDYVPDDPRLPRPARPSLRTAVPPPA